MAHDTSADVASRGHDHDHVRLSRNTYKGVSECRGKDRVSEGEQSSVVRNPPKSKKKRDETDSEKGLR